MGGLGISVLIAAPATGSGHLSKKKKKYNRFLAKLLNNQRLQIGW